MTFIFQYYSIFLISFNPCFGGSYIVTNFNGLLERLNNLFQSLFWWILYCDCFFRHYGWHKDDVSILVLVDLIL